MKEDTFEILARDGLKLQGRWWLPEDEPVGMICLVHGHGEHIGRYEHIGHFFSSHHIAVFGMDLRGHGHSEGKRGHVSAYELLLEDVEDLMRVARMELIETPMFLYGHSMGGNLVANFILTSKMKELQGAILSSPWLRLAFEPPAAGLQLARLIRRVFPALAASSRLNINEISNLAEEVEKYKSDPLIHNRITPQLMLSVMEAGERAIQTAEVLNIPVLAYHGSADKITSWQATKEFSNQSTEHVTFKLWEGQKHELHNDTLRTQVLDFVLEWIKKQL